MKQQALQTATDVKLVPQREFAEYTQELFDAIGRRAYELFESRGRADGRDQEDWLRAEAELVQPLRCHFTESLDQLAARAEVPGFNPHNIRINLEPARLRISGKAEADASLGVHQDITSNHSPAPVAWVFGSLELPIVVDPSKTRATFREGVLEVAMPKAAPASSVRGPSKAA